MILQNLEMFAIIIFFIGLFGLITSKNMVKTVIFVLMIDTAIITFWLSIGRGYIPPIIYDSALLEYTRYIADPLPQTLMLTAIVIGISVAAIKITMLNTIFRAQRLVDWDTLKQIEDESFNEEIYGEHLGH
jgi:multicomponent Na+:H+ antiporter subunit C